MQSHLQNKEKYLCIELTAPLGVGHFYDFVHVLAVNGSQSTDLIYFRDLQNSLGYYFQQSIMKKEYVPLINLN